MCLVLFSYVFFGELDMLEETNRKKTGLSIKRGYEFNSVCALNDGF